MLKTLNTMLIAALAHTLNRAYCQSIGDDSQPSWEDAPDWQKESAELGVKMHLANPDATPEDSHASWLAHKESEGWVYGEVKDEAAKTHPCCLPYDQLPVEQKAKDYIFRAAVHAAKAYTEALPEPEPKTIVVEVEKGGAGTVGGVPVKYIGRRETFKDHLYGSGLTFEQGQVRNLPGELANKFLRHPDVFAKGEAGSAATDDTQAVLQQKQEEQTDELAEQNRLQDVRDTVLRMDKNELKTFATTHYRVELDAKKKVGDLRTEVIGMIDQFGIS